MTYRFIKSDKNNSVLSRNQKSCDQPTAEVENQISPVILKDDNNAFEVISNIHKSSYASNTSNYADGNNVKHSCIDILPINSYKATCNDSEIQVIYAYIHVIYAYIQVIYAYIQVIDEILILIR